MASELESLESLLEAHLPADALAEAKRILFGSVTP